jgi:hypothetical protein
MLSRQIGRLGKKRRAPGLSPQPAHKQAASYFGKIQDASKKLHHALANSWSCETHTEHSASICLNMTRTGGPQTTSSTVRFDLILTSPTNSIVSTEEVLQLSIESAADEPEDAGSGSLSTEVNPLTTLTALLNEVALGPLSTSVAFVLPSASMRNDDSAGSSSATTRRPQKMVDLCSVQNLCLYFRRQLQASTLSPSSPTCLGFLQKTEAFMHYVYPVPRSAPGHRRNSLHDVLLLVKSCQECIPVEDKLMLAKVLAMTVLQFHATPWLRTNWRSNDVLFYAFKDTLAEDSLRTPYMETSLTETRTALSNATQGSLCFAPNRTLFSLGVMLLELGFDAPLSSLQQASDLEDGHETPYSEFFAASRLKRIVGTRLGARYERLVTKCLQCDFGLGSSELDRPDVQNAFFRDVVCELNLCLEAATKF